MPSTLLHMTTKALPKPCTALEKMELEPELVIAPVMEAEFALENEPELEMAPVISPELVEVPELKMSALVLALNVAEAEFSTVISFCETLPLKVVEPLDLTVVEPLFESAAMVSLNELLPKRLSVPLLRISVVLLENTESVMFMVPPLLEIAVSKPW